MLVVTATVVSTSPVTLVATLTMCDQIKSATAFIRGPAIHLTNGEGRIGGSPIWWDACGQAIWQDRLGMVGY